MNPSSSSSLEVSPLSVRGQERLARLRASIHQQFGGDRRPPPAAATGTTTNATAPRTKIRQRLARATQLTADEIFFREFGSPKQLAALDFELARPSPPTVLRQQQQRQADTAPCSSAFSARPESTTTTTIAIRGHVDAIGRTHYAAADRTRSQFHPERRAPPPAVQPPHARLPAAERPGAYVSQLQRPTVITTPKKASLKRLRSADELPSAEKPAQKPRLLSDVTSTFNNRSFSNVAQARGVSVGATTSFGNSPVRKAPGFPRTSLLQQPSPSKFRSSTSATRLFGQRQTTSSYR